MKGYLNHNKISYVLSHFGHSVDITQLALENRIQFVTNTEISKSENPTVYFHLSEKELNYESIRYIDNIPILFPGTDNPKKYYFSEGNLHFEEDFIKSAFYFLSGYQEFRSTQRDTLGRYPYDSSIQKKLGIINKPLVNYYFTWIKEGLTEFYNIHNIPLTLNNPFEPFTFFLSHDVDLVSFHTFNNFLQKIKELVGLTDTRQSKRASFKQLKQISLHLLKIYNSKDPYWNFDYLCSLEKELTLRSTFFFLHCDLKHQDSYYQFKDSQITNLIKSLQSEGYESALHGTIRSASHLDKMIWQKEELEKIINDKVAGVRQHRLLFNFPETANIHEIADFNYDSTLGFPEHEGFRNAYCWPFQLYNFDKDKAFETWEIPLNVMDVSLFHYRKMDFQEALESIQNLIDEIKCNKGIFTLLWHNNHFNEDLLPGIKEFYQALLRNIKEENPLNMTGKEIAEIMQTMDKITII